MKAPNVKMEKKARWFLLHLWSSLWLENRDDTSSPAISVLLYDKPTKELAEIATHEEYSLHRRNPRNFKIKTKTSFYRLYDFMSRGQPGLWHCTLDLAGLHSLRMLREVYMYNCLCVMDSSSIRTWSSTTRMVLWLDWFSIMWFIVYEWFEHPNIFISYYVCYHSSTLSSDL